MKYQLKYFLRLKFDQQLPALDPFWWVLLTIKVRFITKDSLRYRRTDESPHYHQLFPSFNDSFIQFKGKSLQYFKIQRHNMTIQITKK